MHPIIIIAGDKDKAIGAAVDTLQEAGFEVRVLNTATAKLVDFLGALAGADDDEQPAAPVTSQEQEEPPEEETSETNEAIVSGERVIIEMVDGYEMMLHPSTVTVAARTVYSLNESVYSFWPAVVGNEPVFTTVDMEFDGAEYRIQTKLSESTMTPPVLKIGRKWLSEAKNSWAIMRAFHIKNQPTIEDIREAEGKCSVYLCQQDGGSMMWIISGGGDMGVDVGSTHLIHSDQSGRDKGSVVVKAIVHLEKSKDDDRVLGQSKDVYSTKTAAYVFK